MVAYYSNSVDKLFISGSSTYIKHIYAKVYLIIEFTVSWVFIKSIVVNKEVNCDDGSWEKDQILLMCVTCCKKFLLYVLLNSSSVIK